MLAFTLFQTREFIAVVAGFAGCGLVSALIFKMPGDLAVVVTAIPFAIHFSAVCIRSRAGLVVIPFVVAVWPISFYIAMDLSGQSGGDVAICLAGLIGALAIALIGSAFQKRLRSLYALAGASIAGFLGALPFGAVEGKRLAEGSAHQTHYELLFPIWQTAVGAFLYAASVRRDRLEAGRT